MTESLRQRHEALQVEPALDAYPGLRIVPSRNGHLTLRGALDFRATGPKGEEIADSYDVELRIPSGLLTDWLSPICTANGRTTCA